VKLIDRKKKITFFVSSFLFLNSILDTIYLILSDIKRRKIRRDCGKIKCKVFNCKIQVYLIGKCIDNREKFAQYFKTKVGRSSTINKKNKFRKII